MSLVGLPFNDLSATSDLLASPEVRQQVHRLSVDDYQRLGAEGILPRKTELIRGVVFDKPRLTPLHCYLSELLRSWIESGLGSGWNVRTGHPITTADSEPEPDIFVVRGSVDDFRYAHPSTGVLAIEIAVATEKLDQQKAAVYAEAGVEEYWIVLANRKCVEVHRSPNAGKYATVTTLRAGDVLSPLAFPHLSLPVDDLFSAERAAE